MIKELNDAAVAAFEGDQDQAAIEHLRSAEKLLEVLRPNLLVHGGKWEHD